MFKKSFSLFLIIAIFLTGMLMVSSSHAADLIASPYGLENIKGLNLQGDILYLPSSGAFAAGAGTNLAIIADVVEVRGELVEPTDGSGTRAGLGVGVNLPKVVSKLRGNWLLDNINASVGVTGLMNLNGKFKIEPAFYATIIQMEF